MSVVTFNGVDAAALGLRTFSLPSFADGIEYSLPLVTVPGRIGQLLGRLPGAEARTFEIHGRISGETWNDRSNTLDQLISFLSEKELKVVFGDRPDRYVVAYLVQSPSRPLIAYSEPWVGGQLVVSLNFVAPNPEFLAVTETELTGIQSSPVDIPFGTRPHGGEITISGASSAVLTAYNAQMELIGKMSFSGIGGGSVTVDLDRKALRTTLPVNPWTLWTGLEDSAEQFISWSLVDYDYRTSSWPKLAISSGSATYAYRKAYLR